MSEIKLEDKHEGISNSSLDCARELLEDAFGTLRRSADNEIKSGKSSTLSTLSTEYRQASIERFVPTLVLDVKEIVAAAAKPADKAKDILSFDDRVVKLDDGTFKRDKDGRVVEMVSADGKTKRAFKYEDAKFPNRVTTEILNDKTEFRFLGNNTVANEPYKIDGREVNSYSIYEKDQLVGNWNGIREVSRNGVYIIKADADSKVKFLNGSGKEFPEAELKKRESDGIWSAKIEFTRADGSKISAKLNGTKLEKLVETTSEKGDTKQVLWAKDGNIWKSDEQPARERTNMSVTADGVVRYQDAKGIKHEQLKDGTTVQIEGDKTRKYDTKGKLTEVRAVNGDTRSFGYDGDQVISITDKTGKITTTRERKASSDEWTVGGTKETRKDFKVNADGSLEFKNGAGEKVKETGGFAKLTFNAKDQLLKAEFATGSTRVFGYKNDKLTVVTDTVKTEKDSRVTEWKRDGDTDTFKSKESSGKVRTRENIIPSENGDITYSGTDKKNHTSRAFDLERLARGEIVVGSESVQEARERLVEAAEKKGIKSDRFESYLNTLEKCSKRYNSKPEQIALALDNLADILTSKDKSPLYSEDQLKQIVETGLHNIAIPTEIDQGYHPTCNVTTVEVYSAARRPDKYTELLKQIALTGKYKTADGSTVTPPVKALTPGRDEKSYDLDKPNIDKRNIASMVIQMTLINGVYELGRYSRLKDSQTGKGTDDGTRYVMGPLRRKALPNNGWVDLGEDILIDKNGTTKTNKAGDAIDGPEFYHEDVLTASELILGSKMPYIDSPRQRVDIDPNSGLETRHPWEFDLPTKERLVKAKENGLLPLGVPTIKGKHVQTIHDVFIDKNGTCYVLLDNQHGAEKDGWVTLADLHKTQQEDIELKPSIRPNELPK